MFATVLMNKLASIVGEITFHHIVHSPIYKKYFLEAANIPYSLKEDYAKLVRENTDWFDRFSMRHL